MLPLGGYAFPKSHDELVAALTDGLSQVATLPTARQVVEADRDGYPALQTLKIDLTEARVRDAYQPAKPAGERQPGITAARLDILGRPVYSGTAAIYYEVSLTEARLDFQRDARGRNILIPVDARSGRISVRMSQADFEALVLCQARATAGRHGITVESLQWSWQSQGDRSLGAHARLATSKSLGFVTISAMIRGGGQLQIDEQLNARISGVSCEGEGLVGTLIVALAQRRLKRLEGAVVPLASYSLGKLKLRDLKLRCQDGLEAEALFGESGEGPD
jgi:hypothetical protein